MTFPDGFEPTGRRIAGTADDLVGLSHRGVEHTAIVFHPEHRDHPALASMHLDARFLEAPMVMGIAELVAAPVYRDVFVYRTGDAWPLGEVSRLVGQPCGIRAGLQLLHAVGRILEDGAEAGARAGVCAHGGVAPDRIVLARDGTASLIGYGLPPIEILDLRAKRVLPHADGLRFCPPERLCGEPEDIASDLFSLALVAFGLIAGRPLYDGRQAEILEQARRGDGSRRLSHAKGIVPDRTLAVLSKALHPDPAQRFHGADFSSAVTALLASKDATGPTLAELVTTAARRMSEPNSETVQSVLVLPPRTTPKAPQVPARRRHRP